MKLYFMKQSALDFMKANMDTLYKKYYQFDTPEWIEEAVGDDPFEYFCSVDDFSLASLDQQPGEIDLQNCKILYTALKNLSDSQASDERLWAGLCNKTFYSYLRQRWQYARKHLKKTADDASAITLRYFYKNTGRSGMFRNTLARCWWTGRLTYTEKYQNRWELLDAIGSEDLISKISDIFYSNTYSSNSEIVEGFCEGLKFFRDRGIYVSNRDHIRPTAQYLNALGGGVLLDMYSADEIRKLVVDRIGLLRKGESVGLTDESGTEEILDAEDLDDADADEVNVDYMEYLEALAEVPKIDLDSVLGKLDKVEYNSIIYIHKMPQDTYYFSEVPSAGGKLNQLQQWFLGKPVGTEFKFSGSVYTIADIRRSEDKRSEPAEKNAGPETWTRQNGQMKLKL